MYYLLTAIKVECLNKKYLGDQCLTTLNHQNFQTKSEFCLIGKNDVTIFPNTKKFFSSELYLKNFEQDQRTFVQTEKKALFPIWNLRQNFKI